MLWLDRKGDIAYRVSAMPDGLIRHSFTVATDASGDAVLSGVDIIGEALYLDYTHLSGNSTGTVALTLLDAASRDALESQAASLTASASGRVALHQVLHSGQQSRGMALSGGLAFKVDCSDSSARSVLFDFYVRP